MNPSTSQTPRTDAILLERELAEKTNEVERLRAAAQAVVDRRETPLWKDAEPTASVIYRLRDALAPAPEEPVSEGTRIAAEARSACNDLTEEERKRYASLAEDVLKLHRPDEGSVWAKHGLSEPTGPAPDWRELRPDEVIQEGDESICTSGIWSPCISTIGDRPQSYPKPFRFRTRRPLPTPKRTIYIAGPMRGYPEYNFPAFYAAEAQLKADGWNVLSPARADNEHGFNETSDKPLTKEMMIEFVKRDVDMITRCDAIYMLRGYAVSRGACAELSVAEWLDLEIRYQRGPEDC